MDFFTNPLFHIGEINFALINFLVFFAVLLLSKFVQKFVRILLKRYTQNKNFNFRGKDYRFDKLAKQFVQFITLFFLYESIQIGNKVELSDVLNISIFSFDKFKFQIKHIFLLTFIYFISRTLLNLIRLFIFKSLEKKGWMNEGMAYTVITIAKYIVFTIAFTSALSSMGLKSSYLITSAAALFVGIGFGLQDFFRDLISGFILLFEGSVKVGDVIEAENLTARVLEIGIRTSKVVTRSGKVIILPNTRLVQEGISNWSYNDNYSRYSVDVGVAYGSDTEKVRDILTKCAFEHDMVDRNKKILVFFEEFGDSSLNFKLLFWTDKNWQIPIIKSDIRFAIDKEFRNHNITIPFPQRDLHIIQPNNFPIK